MYFYQLRISGISIFYFISLQPRLGPKPFSAPKLKDLGETSPTSEFDKVFSVPSAPKSMYGANCVQNGHHASKPDYHSNKDAANHVSSLIIAGCRVSI